MELKVTKSDILHWKDYVECSGAKCIDIEKTESLLYISDPYKEGNPYSNKNWGVTLRITSEQIDTLTTMTDFLFGNDFVYIKQDVEEGRFHTTAKTKRNEKEIVL